MAKIYPWQQSIINAMQKGSELKIIHSGRNVGKSHFSAQAVTRLMHDLMLMPVEDLVLSVGTVYGARYHCVEPVGGNWRDMEDWCIETFGASTGSIWAEEHTKQTPNPGERWYGNNRKFWFRNEKDRDWFILRWRS